MQARVCPVCGAKWFGADNSGTWQCSTCGTEIPPPGPGVCRVCGCTDMYGCPSRYLPGVRG